MMGLISWIVVGAIGGWLAGYVLEKNTALNITDVILGMVGAIVGGWLSGMFLGVEPSGISPLGIISAFVGALIVATVYKKMTGKTAQ